MTKLDVCVNSRTDSKTGEQYFEGTCEVPGLKATKLVKADGCTRYSSKSQVSQAARRLADKFNLAVTVSEPEMPVHRAAKKSVKSVTPNCCDKSACSWAD